ncbi:MAG: site-specific DNA-methyltransferase [Pseudomonadales bacterium]|nr:site-specific DNA-methyltransferase [Pseudomonadales bacterium]
MRDEQEEITGSSEDQAALNRDKLAALLPEAFSEGRLDIDALRRTLGEDFVVEDGERYRLDWAGKRDAYKVLQTPTTATLRPQRDKSLNFDDAQHVFIEGENLEVLKVLQKSYFGKIKLIYIDPPYNTGNDSFIYPDRFQENKEDYLKRVNELDDDGTLMREGFFRKNNRENGHYHSNWLNMMLPRLYIARNLLRQDGFIVVSIDDSEFQNLRSIMNEVFGEENFIASLVYDRNRKNDAKLFSVGHEYMVVYARDKAYLSENDVRLRTEKEGLEEIKELFERLRVKYSDDWEKVETELRLYYKEIDKNDPRFPLTRFKKVDAKGPYRTDGDTSWPGGGGPRYDVPHPKTGRPCKVPRRGWLWPTYKRMEEQINDGRIIFGPDESTIPSVRMNLFENTEQVMASVSFSYAQKATKDLDKIFGGKKVFDNPKNYFDLEQIVAYLSNPGDLVLDFFAGSGTSAHGVILSNQSETVGRKFICVQLPEPISDDSEAGKNALALGYQTIADLCRDRIRRVFKLIEEQADLATPVNDGNGFKSLLLAPSNFKIWRGDDVETAEQLADQIRIFEESGKKGADTEAIFYELLLRQGQDLTTNVDLLEIEGQTLHAINDNKMLFILESFSEPMIDPIVALEPDSVMVLDSVFQGSDELKSNLELHCRDAGIKFTCV